MSDAFERFGLTSRLWQAETVLPIEAAHFQELVSAKDCLLACLNLEEAYDLVILNYISFETAMVATVVGNLIEKGMARAEQEAARREIDRHIVNLLAVGEMYGDHLRVAAKRVFGRKSPERDAIDQAFEKQRTTFVGFRASEKLRDAVLHHALPVSSWSSGGRWLDRDGEKMAVLQHSFSVGLDPSVLECGRGSDPKLAGALKARADKDGSVSWTSIVREYVEGLSNIHKDARELFGDREKAALELIEIDRQMFRATDGVSEYPGLVVVVAVELGRGGRHKHEVTLEFDYEERIGPLRKKNGQLVNLYRREILG